MSLYPLCARRFVLLALLVFATARVAEAKSFYGTFSAVLSGDRLVVEHDAGSYDLHVYGIDAPRDGEPLGLEARLFTRAWVMGEGKLRRIRVMSGADGGLMEAQILVDGEDLALALLRAGLVRRQPDVRYKPHSNDEPDALVAAELEGRRAGRGLWRRPSSSETELEAVSNEGVEGTVDRNLSKKSGNDAECAIIADPANASQLFQSCNTGSAGLFAARSTDGGATWIYPDPADKTIADGDAGQGTSACCDPTLAWDSFGNLYVTYISSSLNAIVTLLSTDGGATFSPLASFSGSVDQPTVVAADVPGGAAVWVVWNQSNAIVARGALATGLGVVGAFSALQTAPTTSSCNFGDLAIAPSGAVVQVCGNPSSGQGPSSIRLNLDADGLGPNGFGASSIATTTNVGGFDFLPAQNSRSVDPEAGLAYDANPASPHYGRLYLVYTEETVAENHDMEIMLRWSDDDGATWSAPLRVNDDATTRSQILPKLATDPATGNLAACWHDARNSGTNTAIEIYCASTTPAGASPTFTANSKLSDGASTSNGSGVEFGDYMGLTFRHGVITPTWGDTSNSTGDNPGGTATFDAYVDQLTLTLFADGFESGDAVAWSSTCPAACVPD